MKNLGLYAFILLFIFSSCRKEVNIVTTDTTTPEPMIVNDWVQEINNVTGSVTGFIVDENDEPIADVAITLGNLTTTTDAFGHFFFTNELLNTLGTYITTEKAGFFKGSRRFFPIEGRENRIKIQLLEKSFDQTMNSQTGGTIAIGSDATVDFTGGGFFLANGAPYNGTVHVATKYLDPTTPATFDQMPGNLQGVNNLAEEVVLGTYGMIALEMEGDNGEPLNINADNAATIKIGLPTTIAENAPTEIPLWFFDEAIGLWVEEGTAELQNGQYIGTVTHFTFWNCDAPFPVVATTFKVITTNDTELENVKVQLRFDNATARARVVCGYTDANGEVSGKVPEGEVLALTVYDHCDQVVFTTTVGPFDATSNFTEVLVPVASLGLTSISGTLVDCNGGAVSNGAVLIIEGDNTSYQYIRDGRFSFNSVTCGSGDAIEVVGVNVNDLLQSDPVVATSGTTNTLGNISVCAVEFNPIREASFEDNDPTAAACGSSLDGRECWRNSALGGVIQITGSPVVSGVQAAKLPPDQTRIGYQEIAVEANTNYDLKFWYTMKDDSRDPWITVDVLGVTQFGPFATSQEARNGTLGSVTVNDTSNPNEYIEQTLLFNSGDNNTVAIYFFNGPVEARLDDFSIEVGTEGAIPPSARFDIAQSEENFLAYTFTSTSTGAISWFWDFGDGNTSNEESPTHIYDTPGNYNVTLEVTSENGLTGTLVKRIDIQVPVIADCQWAVDSMDYQTVSFTNASIGAVTLWWEFGDGFQATDTNPVHTYAADGIYTVALIATSVTGLTDVHEFQVTISQGVFATISEGGFEENSLADGTGDGRDSWRNNALGGVIQITSGPVVSGSQAAKLPSDGSRSGYQRVMVEPNTMYTVSFNYTMKTSPEGSLTVSILDGRTLNDLSEVAGATIASLTVNDQTDANAYIMETITFNSGNNTEIAIFFINEGVECRLDDFSIMAN